MFIFQIASLFEFDTNQCDGFHVFNPDFFTRVYILIIIGISANRYRHRLIFNISRWELYSAVTVI